jgi:TRAP-type mannitol/chloroaromatic compound transport system permease large subunit
MNTVGLWMLLALAVASLATPLPFWALLLGASSAFAVFGIVAGAFDASVLAAIPIRVSGLLENDLLQALPLYVFVGVLLQRLHFADAIFETLARIFAKTGASRSLATVGTACLIAPMNGSVASSASLMARLVGHRLHAMPPSRSVALLCASSSIGVVVPPSLVLVLLGDAMLRAHTEASNLPGAQLAGQRIISTQDVFQAALIPALLVIALWILASWRSERLSINLIYDTNTPLSVVITSIAVQIIIVALLVGVFSGVLLAVEAAATAGTLLLIAAVFKRSLRSEAWREMLRDTLVLTGALFAMLVGATTFSLVFRAFGTDRWLLDAMVGTTLSPQLIAFAILCFVAICALALEAFEMIFVIVPIVAPALIVQLGDAQQTAVLLLLVLQLSFLLPPIGYAVVVVRARSGIAPTTTTSLIRALAPYVIAQLLVIALVFGWPRIVHLTTPPATLSAPTLNDEDVTKRMREMSQ